MVLHFLRARITAAVDEITVELLLRKDVLVF